MDKKSGNAVDCGLRCKQISKTDFGNRFNRKCSDSYGSKRKNGKSDIESIQIAKLQIFKPEEAKLVDSVHFGNGMDWLKRRTIHSEWQISVQF